MNKLLHLMRKLRSKSGCPWDRKQTMDSLRRCVLEEAHEVMEAISLKDKAKIEEELGDLLVVISMLINLGEEKRLFSRQSVIDRAVQKMISRHPHVFGDKKARTAEEALAYFTEVKIQERRDEGEQSILEGLKHHWPALLLAYKVQRRVARVGFDWKKAEDVLAKIKEELGELEHELASRNRKKLKEELGDFLFSSVNLARKLNLDPEIVLKDAVGKFRKRFVEVEKQVKSSGKDWNEFQLKDLDLFWERAKRRKVR